MIYVNEETKREKTFLGSRERKPLIPTEAGTSRSASTGASGIPCLPSLTRCSLLDKTSGPPRPLLGAAVGRRTKSVAAEPDDRLATPPPWSAYYRSNHAQLHLRRLSSCFTFLFVSFSPDCAILNSVNCAPSSLPLDVNQQQSRRRPEVPPSSHSTGYPINKLYTAYTHTSI